MMVAIGAGYVDRGLGIETSLWTCYGRIQYKTLPVPACGATLAGKPRVCTTLGVFRFTNSRPCGGCWLFQGTLLLIAAMLSILAARVNRLGGKFRGIWRQVFGHFRQSPADCGNGGVSGSFRQFPADHLQG